jgi:hypothetical protein
MPQQQQNVPLKSPGFLGINTQDSPIDMDISYAAAAENAVIEREGRLGTRKGFVQYTQTPDILQNNPVISTQEFIAEDGTKYLFACGNNMILRQSLSTPYALTEVTLPVDYSITGDNWQIIPFNDKCYFLQAGHQPLVFRHADGLDEVFVVTIPGIATFPHCGTGGFGHLWAADFDGDKSIIFWSDFLNGEAWDGLTSGSLDVTEVWPSGFDEIRAIKVHNNFLVIFGRDSIVVYNVPSGTDTSGNFGPAFMSLIDTVEGIGNISRDAVQATGTDLLFLDSTGLRSFGRTIQEKSLPVGNLSYNVRDDLQQAIKSETEAFIKSVYNPEENYYALFFPNSPITYVFDTRGTLENGSARCTTWVGVVPRCASRTVTTDTWFGGKYGLYTYEGYKDVFKQDDIGFIQEQAIPYKYVSHPFTFGDPVTVKFPKQADVTVLGGEAKDLEFNWAYDYSRDLNITSQTLVGGQNEPGLFNVDEFNTLAEFGTGAVINQLKFNIWGSGRNIKLGFKYAVFGEYFSIQEVNLQTLVGRML